MAPKPSPLPCAPAGTQQGWLFGTQEAGLDEKRSWGLADCWKTAAALGTWGLHATPSSRAAVCCSLKELAAHNMKDRWPSENSAVQMRTGGEGGFTVTR